jgi:hypothetical protein
MSAVSFGAEIEREKAQQRVTDAMVRKARAGYVTGGTCFGYDNIEITSPDGHRSHVERRINEREAEVIRQIFYFCAAGKGVKAIAKSLNAEGSASPRPVNGRPKGWARSSVRSALHRRTYLGEIRYGMTKKRDAWGQRRTQKRPVGEVLVVSQPAWRIISDAAWQAAHARLDAASQTYTRATKGQPWGRPPTGIVSKYLLSGLSRCGQCGGSMIAHFTTHGAHRWPYYICSTFSNRGRAICPNGLSLPMVAADRAVLDQFEQVVLDPEIVEAAIADALVELQPSSDALEAARAALAGDLRRVEEEQRR